MKRLPGLFSPMLDHLRWWNRRLACRYTVGNLLMVLLVGGGFYFLALLPMARFIERCNISQMADAVDDIQRICEQSHNELLRTGVVPDSIEYILKQVATLSFIEDFLTANRLQILLVNNQQVLLAPDLPTPLPKATGKLLGTDKAYAERTSEPAALGALVEDLSVPQSSPEMVTLNGREYHLQGGTFSPWDWQFVVFRDSGHFLNTISQVHYAYFGTVILLLFWVLFSGYFFRRQVETPVNEMINALRQGKKPDYRGVYEFEFLSQRFAEYMEEQQALHRRFFQQQKLESVGVMAGGIAHDFNNLLTALYGQISLAELSLPADHPARAHLSLAEGSANRARFLTRQLLTFTTGNHLHRRPLTLSRLLPETARFALTGSNCELQFSADEDLWPTELDPEQMGNVFHNLVLNARDAMGDNGELTISCRNLELPADTRLPLPPGRYVRIVFQDNGCGMEPEVLSRIFDPYFSTKEKSSRKGTGLGLAICYSVINQHGGHIEVDSVKGQGTVFTLYLPATDGTDPVTEQLRAYLQQKGQKL
ncbi:two-component system sensor histidine kinase NtrB [Desulfurivibrio alkaliphilus]|uniref:histidine kinase n=1 Tax=Desulfurivibrio alkaliphilus (strain DSM 19089 / UNIQEM U267 / AHT2) TaxID=589865 RepID=D6Z1G3_DESAT|nr:ATP-binding protein [Desulfurivibrio alkaliphilus]ADH85418.1 integral membrane sensor signal transduction histidine kinase [Desulfurivibrio alkaliphilus AHT 2]